MRRENAFTMEEEKIIHLAMRLLGGGGGGGGQA